MDIYVIYECNAQKSFKSYCIKGMFTDRVSANKVYRDLVPVFRKDNIEGWFLVLAVYYASTPVTEGSDVFRELETIDTSKT